MTCREIAIPGQYARLLCARGSTQRPVRTEQVFSGFLQRFHHNCLLYSYQLCVVPESLQFCSWGQQSCTRHKSKGLCFVLFGSADLLWRTKDPEGPAENKQLTCRGHKVYFTISFSMPHFPSGLTLFTMLERLLSQASSISHPLVSFCQQGAAHSTQARTQTVQVLHPVIQAHRHRIIYQIDK